MRRLVVPFIPIILIVVALLLLLIFREPHRLTPHWPDSEDRWLRVIALVILGSVKSDRGGTMQRRASVIDHFGWSLIVFDRVLGAFFLASALFLLYPRLDHIWISRFILVTAIAIALWNWLEIRLADSRRLDHAAGGNMANEVKRQAGNPERRRFLRRNDDRKAYEALKREEEAI